MVMDCHLDKLSFAILILAVGLFLSCRNVREYLDFTRSEPNKSDLVGTWTPDRASLGDMRTRGHYDPNVEPKLILRADDSFDLINMPDWWENGFGESHGTFRAYSGKWGVSQEISKFWQLFLSGRNVELFGQKAPYRLNFIIGDPDSDESMVFEKQ